MRAERDDDEARPPRQKTERRLAYEIAIGIVIGGSVLMILQDVHALISAKLLLGEIRMAFPG